MNKFFIFTGAALALAFGGSAHAADIAVTKARPAAAAVAAPVYNWSGWYVGGHAGTADANYTGVFDTAGAVHPWSANSSSGGVFGAQIGANWQRGMWVYGVEVDWSAANVSKSVVDLETNTQEVEAKSLFSARGRVGVAANNWLFYGTAGWGRGKFEVGTELDVPASAARRSITGDGLVYGGGIEWAFLPNWSLRAEYLRYNFGDTLDYPVAIVPDADAGDFFKVKNVNVARVGLNYTFNWGKLPY